MMHCYFCHDSLVAPIVFYTGPGDGQMAIYGKPAHKDCAERAYQMAYDAYLDQEDYKVAPPSSFRKAHFQFVAKDYTNA